MGDSLTNEYTFSAPLSSDPTGPALVKLPDQAFLAGRGSARNWPLILAALRSNQLSMGDYTTSDRGATRGQGFAQDWASDGAQVGGAGDLLDDTLARQVYGNSTSPGLVTQTTATTGANLSDINEVTIWVGIDNYLQALFNYVSSSGASDSFRAPAGSALTQVNAVVESGIAESVKAIQAASPSTKVVLVTVPDITQTPLIRSYMASFLATDPAISGEAQASDAELTADLTRFAQQTGVGLVDFDEILANLEQAPRIGNLAVDVDGAGASPEDAYVGDGFHFGTPVQGRLAQAIAAAIDQLYGSDVIAPISDAELAAYASLTTSTVTLAGTTAAGSATTTLAVDVASAPGQTFAAQGTVTLARYFPAEGLLPAYRTDLPESAVLTDNGTATLIIPTSDLAHGPIVAVYEGDLLHTQQDSAILTAPDVTVTGSPDGPIIKAKVANDYDGDGRSDLAVQLAGFGAFACRTAAGDAVQPFGIPGDGQSIPAPGDYDGDGRTDVAAYLPSLGVLAYRPSGGGPDVDVPFGPTGIGTSAAIPMAGDYDGDGKTDVAFYLPASGTFIVDPSSGTTPYAVQFGPTGSGAAIPVPGDYDGDGRTDIALYLPASGAFVVDPSTGAAPYTIPFGIPGQNQTIPAPGDYDGDGKIDIAAYLPRYGSYAYRPSGGGADILTAFGPAGAGNAVPVPGDYDGDGKADIALYLPGSGAFAIDPSGGAAPYPVPFGQPGAGNSIPATAVVIAQDAPASAMALDDLDAPDAAGAVPVYLPDLLPEATARKKSN